MSNLDQIVFLVQDGQIIESPIRALHGFIDETTTPAGVGPRLHLRDGVRYEVAGASYDDLPDAEAHAIDVQNETRTRPEIHKIPTHEVWTWGVGGNCPRLLETHETLAAATESLENSWAKDLWDSPDFPVFPHREEAEKFLADCQE